MSTSKLKPSHFTSHPWESILNKSESETIARNIMVIRKRRGDKWALSWAEYKAERKRDGANEFAVQGERSYFEEIIKLIPDAIGAIRFCPDWAADARKASR